MTVFYIFAAAFFVLFIWLTLQNENRLADVSFIRKLVLRVSLLVYGLCLLTFPILLKFVVAGPMAPVLTLLVTSSFCSSVVIVSLVRVVFPSAQLWASQKYWYIVLSLSVLLAVVSILGVFLSRGLSLANA